jgi:hypothetical protein
LTHLDSIGFGILLAALPREWFLGLARSRRQPGHAAEASPGLSSRC